MSEDKELDEMMKRMRAHLRTSSSHGNIHGVDPDNPFAIRQHEKEASNFYKERSELKANILYVHGLASSGNSGTARTIQKYLPNSKVFSPDLPVNPHEALALLNNIVANEKIDVVVGTSMGAFYAQMMHGWRRILVNPSFHTSQAILRPNFGKTMPFFLPRRDGVQEYTITEELCRSIEDVESHQFDPGYGITNGCPDTDDIVKAYFGLRDTTVNCRYEYLQHYTRCDFFDGSHRLEPKTMTDIIVPEIRRLIAESNA